MASDGLYQQAVLLLSACEDILSTTMGGTPARSFVSPGTPADDCEMLTVRVDPLNEDNKPAGNLKRTTSGRVNLPTYVIRVTRCIDTSDAKGNAAPAAMLQVAANLVLQDAWSLWCGLMQKVREGDLFNSCGEFYMDRATPIPILGNVAGWEIAIRASINGYEV